MKSENVLPDFEERSHNLGADLASLTVSGKSAPVFSQPSLLAEYLVILRRRRWIIISVVLVTIVLSALITARQKPMYSAVGRIAINHESAINLGSKDSQLMLGENDESNYSVDMETQIKVLQSDAISYNVLKALHLDTSSDFGGSPSQSMENGLRIDSAQQTDILSRFRAGLRIASVPATRILEIRYSSHNPKLAAQIVNQLINSYIEQHLRARFESTVLTSDWLTQQLADLQLKVEISQQKLVEYQRENGIVGLDDKSNVVTSKLEQLNMALTAVEGQRMQKEAAYHMALSGNPELLQQSTQDRTDPLEAFHSKEADLRTQLAATMAQFGPNFPKVKELSAQIAELENQTHAELKRALDRAKAEYVEAEEHERVLQAAFEKQKQEANRLEQNEIEYSLLKQNAESYRTLYDSLLQRLKEAGVAAGLKSSNIQIVDQARVPTAPYAPNVPRSLISGLVLGCFLGLVTIFMLDSLDNTVRTAEEAELISSLSAIAIIPARKTRKIRQALRDGQDHSAREIFSVASPNSEIAESFRSLRTGILLSSRSRGSKVLLVTSAMPQDGKTTTSMNVAVVLAQAGLRVLLIDGDLRRPKIHKILQLPNTAGLSTWLAGTDTDKPQILPSGIPNLDILPTGPKPPYPAELFGLSVFGKMLDGVRSEYDHVIIDSPPVLSVTDAVLISALADSVLLVIRSRKTTKGALRRSLKVLHQANARIMAFVLNDFSLNDEEYSYQYGYGRSTGYYSDGSNVDTTKTSSNGHDS